MPPKLAAWTHVARVLLNLHETVTQVVNTMNRSLTQRLASVHRRAFLGRAAQGVGAVALASLLDPIAPPRPGPAAPGDHRPPDLAAARPNG